MPNPAPFGTVIASAVETLTDSTKRRSKRCVVFLCLATFVNLNTEKHGQARRPAPTRRYGNFVLPSDNDTAQAQQHQCSARRNRYARADAAVRPYAEDLFQERASAIKHLHATTRRRVECGAGVPGAGDFSQRGLKASTHSAFIRAGTVHDGQKHQIVTK